MRINESIRNSSFQEYKARFKRILDLINENLGVNVMSKYLVNGICMLLFFTASVIKLQKVDNTISIRNLLLKEITKYPDMEIQDIYKFLHQAAMGSEHAVKDTSAVRKWMENEIANLDWNHSEELIDTLSPDGRIVRVNLRPYLKAGHDPEKLLNAFVKTANEFKGDKSILENYIAVVLEMIDKGEIDFSNEEAKKFFIEQKQKGYSAVHHSKKYAELYSPAYRVVAKKYISFLDK